MSEEIKILDGLNIKDKSVMIFTDGACSMNKTWTGGWAYMLITSKGKHKISSGYEYRSTNNRMEVMAIIRVLKDIRTWERKSKKKLDNITLVSDSGYSVFPFLRYGWVDKWKNNQFTEDTKNYDLWCELMPLAISYGDRLNFRHMRGHNKDSNKTYAYYNDIVDGYAVNERLVADKRKGLL